MDQSILVSRWLDGEIPGIILPWQVDIDLTNVCNQNCYYCNSADFRNNSPTHQTAIQYIDLIEQLTKWRHYDPNTLGTVSNIIFSGGGEPTLLHGYEDVIAASIQFGFHTAMNTNGTRLHKLLELPAELYSRMAYIGLDIDSGVEETYELIRRSKSKTSPFKEIKEVATELTAKGAPIDIKALLMPENTSRFELMQLFQFANDVDARGVHLRPMVLNNKAFEITDSLITEIKHLSFEFGMPVNIATDRMQERQYTKCHQMFLFPSFCADGNIYVCCEYKGNESVKLGSWRDSEWRQLWCSNQHKDLYDSFLVDKCKPCRPNATNNQIELAKNNISFI